MHSAHDLRTRWPALDVAAKRARLQDTFQLSSGPLREALPSAVNEAERAAASLWRRDPAIWSSDPAVQRTIANRLGWLSSPALTLYILASKSGTTIEPNSLAAHFRHRLEASVAHWNEHFVAITDEGTELAERARRERFRDVFINPSDIGGRYSAMSFFGLVPAALMGQNLAALVGWALGMLSACEPGFGDVTANPAAALGLAIGVAARAGRDKLTLILPT